jgi:hypothetical protein
MRRVQFFISINLKKLITTTTFQTYFFQYLNFNKKINFVNDMICLKLLAYYSHKTVIRKFKKNKRETNYKVKKLSIMF